MYKNFNLTDEERKQIMEHHNTFGYKKPKAIMEQATKSSLIGRSATFYATEQEAQDAYDAGKPNPSAKGAIIGTITGMDKIENDYVSFKVKVTKGVHDDRGAVGKLLGGGIVFTYMRENGYFTVEGMRGKMFYSESVKEILNKEFFTSDLASNKPQNSTSSMMAEEIDTDDEEMELSKMYDDNMDDYDDDLKAFDGDMDDYNSAFEASDDYEDLYDLSVAKQNLPKDKVDNMGYSRTMDMDYEGAKHHDEIPGSIPTHRKVTAHDGTTYNDYWAYPKPQSDEMGYYLKTYGTPDPDMESETLADKKKNTPINFPKYTDKDRRDPENLLSWEQKKALLAQRAEKAAAREAAKEKRLAAASLKPGINESKKSIRLTESQLIDLVRKVVKESRR